MSTNNHDSFEELDDPVSTGHAPTKISSGISIIAGGTVVLALGGGTGSVVAFMGVFLIGLGLYANSRRPVSIGAFLLLAGVLLAGLSGQSPGPLVLGMITTVIAWDVGEHAITVGEQLGRNAPTTRLELTHAIGTAVAGILTAGIGVTIFRFATGGQPVAALVFLLAAALAFIVAIQ
ncbi:MAG: hypothetical protein SVG88_03325 [Halobacteriales archaeon]|nr:hypothetical protein [Halobacteriales archaeon]